MDAVPELELWGATLFDGLELSPIPDGVVEIRGDRVTAVRRGRPRGAGQAVDLRGHYLLPGLIDAHAHAEQGWVFAALQTMGILAIRNPATRVDARREATPPIAMRAAGPAIDGPTGDNPHTITVADAAALAAEVRRQAAAGFDYIKLYHHLPPELVRAGVAAAHDAGLAAIGDLAETSWTEAARAGIDFLCHAIPRHPDLLPATVRERYRHEVQSGRVHPYVRWLELVDLDGRELHEMIAALVEDEVAVDPTLVALEAMLYCGDPDYHAAIADRLLLVPVARRHLQRPPELSPPALIELRRQADAAWKKALGLVERLHRGGVTLLAGSDAPRPFVVPGASLHRELTLLVLAGLSPLEALRSATGRAAHALGLDRETGTIAPGRRADLILLRDDPFAEIANTTSIEWVMKSGTIEPTRSSGPQ